MSMAVIFDIDGVLIDSYDAHYQSWRALAKEHGFDVTQQQFAASFGRTSRDIIGAWWGDGVSDEQARQMDDRKEALFRGEIRRSFPAMPGAVALIDALHAEGFALAVGSSGPPANVNLVLGQLGRESAFAVRVTGQDVTRGKPDPQVFLIAAQRLDVPPQRCAVVEDAPAGIAAANAAGMISIALTGTADADGLKAAALVVSSLDELSPGRIKALIDRRAD